MKLRKKRGFALLLALALTLALALPAAAVSDLEGLVAQAGDRAYAAAKDPAQADPTEGWTALSLARSGYPLPQSWIDAYCAALTAEVQARNGVLHPRKYTEFSRVILNLSALGMDAREVGGYDLTLPLGDFDQTAWQGLNGPIWALIALDSVGYPVPENPAAKTQATRQMYVDEILSRQMEDGGWTLSSAGSDRPSDVDITAMALQALAKYRDQDAVEKATLEALACMSARQEADGGFSAVFSTGGDPIPTAESCAQMVVALCALGIDPEGDERFLKNGLSPLDALLSYRLADGSFAHTHGGGADPVATDQGFYAIVAVQRLRQGKSPLYDMSDTDLYIAPAESAPGLPEKHQDVTVRPVVEIGKTFPDIQGSDCQTAVEALASRAIINGKPGGLYDPDGDMTRCEFATIVVKALGLPEKADKSFPDVPEDTWYTSVANTAGSYGIVTGDQAGNFNAMNTISRQEAAIMLCRAARLCGMETEMTPEGVRNALAWFSDYPTVASWAKEQVAFCYARNIFNNEDMDVEPVRPITRGEIAQAIYNLLASAKLL